MRMPRMTTRRLMVAVAVVAILMGGELMRRRRAAYLERLERRTFGWRTICGEILAGR
jgi:hypothetical protein